jgi:hypothetical protein
MTEGTNKIISICHYKRRFRTKSIRTSRQNASVTVKGQTVGVPVEVVAQLEEKLTTMEKPGVNYIWVVIKKTKVKVLEP